MPSRPSPFGPGFGPHPEFRSQLATDRTPRVQSVNPNFDRTSGGASVTITGEYFRLQSDGSAPNVQFDVQNATDVVVVDANTITCTVPAAVPEDPTVVDVHVTIDGQIGTLSNAFSYYEGRIDRLEPAYGPVAGGTQITIIGDNFADGTTITFDGIPGTNAIFVDEQHYVVTTPAGLDSGFVNVVMSAPTLAELRNGFQYTRLVRGQDIRLATGITIRDVLNNTPNTCTFTVDGESNIPEVGEKITILDGATVIFAGNVLSVEQNYEGQIDQLAWSVSCVDFTWLLNRRRPYGTYNVVSASLVVIDLINKYAPGFTTDFVQTRLAPVSVSFDGSKDFSTCLTEIAQMIGGGHWYVDYQQRVHFFHVVPPNIVLPTDPQAVLREGPGTPMTISTGSAIPSTFTVPPAFYLFFSTFVYDNGVESAPSPLSNLYLHNGRSQFDFSGVPIGPDVGTMTCVARRIYARQYSGIGGGRTDNLMRWCQVNDNSTTSFSVWFRFTTPSTSAVGMISEQTPLPRRPFVPPPAMIKQRVAVEEVAAEWQSMEEFVGTPNGYDFVGTAPGNWKFRVSQLYRDGTESFVCQASERFFWQGQNRLRLTNVPIGPTLNGVPVIARKIYGLYLGGSGSSFVLMSEDWTRAFHMGWIDNNTSTDVEVNPHISGPLVIKVDPEDIPGLPTWPNEDGPFLENLVDPPDDITENSDTLLRDPQFASSVDLSQIRNRVVIVGAGTSMVSAAIVQAQTIEVADLSVLSPAGGFIRAGSQVIQYTGVEAEEGPGLIFLQQPLAQAIAQGEAVNLFFQVDDEESQKALSRVERDSSGNLTDGIHEFVIVDTSLTEPFQLYMRAFAEIELYSRPTVTIRYATRDSKTRTGQVVNVDLLDPPCRGEFLIQEVTIDQIEIANDLEPRYTVSASSNRFELNDLIYRLMEDIASGQGSGASVKGLIPSAVAAVPSVDGVVQTVVRQLTQAEIISGNTSPILLVSGVANMIHMPVWVIIRKPAWVVPHFNSSPSWTIIFSAIPSMNGITPAIGANLASTFSDFNAAMGSSGVGSQLGNNNMVGSGLSVRSNGNTTGGSADKTITVIMGYISLPAGGTF